MVKRGFNPKSKIMLKKIRKKHLGNWEPYEKNIKLIKKRLIDKIKLKPNYYRYYGEKRGKNFFIKLIRSARC